MKTLVLVALWALLGFPLAAQEKPLDEGKFLIFSAGQQVGTESFSIKDAENAVGTVNLRLGARAMPMTVSTSYRGSTPLLFTFEQAEKKFNFALFIASFLP